MKLWQLKYVALPLAQTTTTWYQVPGNCTTWCQVAGTGRSRVCVFAQLSKTRNWPPHDVLPHGPIRWQPPPSQPSSSVTTDNRQQFTCAPHSTVVVSILPELLFPRDPHRSFCAEILWFPPICLVDLVWFTFVDETFIFNCYSRRILIVAFAQKSFDFRPFAWSIQRDQHCTTKVRRLPVLQCQATWYHNRNNPTPIHGSHSDGKILLPTPTNPPPLTLYRSTRSTDHLHVWMPRWLILELCCPRGTMTPPIFLLHHLATTHDMHAFSTTNQHFTTSKSFWKGWKMIRTMPV